MDDPYILKNGTLKNKLNITDYTKLKQAERDIGFVKLMNAEQVITGKTDEDMIKRIHRHIFEDIFDWAGEYRTVPIYKTELVIPCISLEYSQPREIHKQLKENLEAMNSHNWKNRSIDEISEQFSIFLTKLWRIHPYRDGNTRTILTFANIFAKQHGFGMDMTSMLDQLSRKYDPVTEKVIRYSVRDRFVLAALDEKDKPERQYLTSIIKRGIINGRNKSKKEDEFER